MNEDYVSYELAVKLKACGFDEPCLTFYDASKELGRALDSGNFNHLGETYQGEWFTDTISTPTLYHAQKWLREKKEICVTVYAQPYNGLPYYTGYILFEGDEKEILDQDGHWYDDYEKCLSDTISAALELIKKGE